MTPKEKAKELVEKLSDLEDGEMYIGKAKQCTLIAVDEIQKLPNMKYDNNKDKSQYDYWQEVKEELLKIK